MEFSDMNPVTTGGYPFSFNKKEVRNYFIDYLEEEGKCYRKKDLKSSIIFRCFVLSILTLLHIILQNTNIFARYSTFRNTQLCSRYTRELAERKNAKVGNNNTNNTMLREGNQEPPNKSVKLGEKSRNLNVKMDSPSKSQPSKTNNPQTDRKQIILGETSRSLLSGGDASPKPSPVGRDFPQPESKPVETDRRSRHNSIDKGDNAVLKEKRVQGGTSEANENEKLDMKKKGNDPLLKRNIQDGQPLGKEPSEKIGENGINVELIKKNEDLVKKDISKFEIKDLRESINKPDFEITLLRKYNRIVDCKNVELPYGCTSSDFIKYMSELDLSKKLENLKYFGDPKSMYLIYKYVHDHERVEFWKVRNILWKLCEDLEAKFKIPKEIKIKEWNNIFAKLIEELLKKDQKSYAELHELIKIGNCVRSKFIEFIVGKRHSWKLFSNEMNDKFTEELATNLVKYAK
ncbi:Plasmodium exported protein, unknown function [Plasmodium malariae]|uniref:Plasmodium RESA N-terminal domain-containing protein n=1 Tax=Plasmodium malariae TaxID=5858 RepID=A0A1A8X0I7_PLAMA|nr:Plasmodium exported protein, unknown function [Plasmodium malariae]SBS98750.1 Plasmodium exported protein (PHIST), unknown function [Plasmodium malariae]SBT86608.1 Plasmodium exported protein, unknown function [Plasmodium malariae]